MITRISSRIQLALLAYIYMIRSGRKDTGKYVALFGKCVIIISTLTLNITGSKRLMLDDQATKLVLIMSMVMIILKTEKDV